MGFMIRSLEQDLAEIRITNRRTSATTIPAFRADALSFRGLGDCGAMPGFPAFGLPLAVTSRRGSAYAS